MKLVRYSLLLLIYWFTTSTNSTLLPPQTRSFTDTLFTKRANNNLPTSIHQNGLNGEACSSNSDCVSPRQCLTAEGPDNATLKACPGTSACACVAVLVCKSDSDCVQGEVCRNLNGTDFCVGPTLAQQIDNPNSSNDSDGSKGIIQLDEELAADSETKPVEVVPAKCIAVHHLHEWKYHQLVYDKHYRQNVLCDENNSCATPGHMVRFKDKVVMMATYCNTLAQGCKRRVMEVNSPRFRVGRVVNSHTKDLLFTVFAARYETQAEERFLSAAIRIGF